MRILLVFHAYYEEHIPYYLEKMGNIHSCEWDLKVTYNTLSEKSRKLISAAKPDADFIQVENSGYDIWPFIKVIKSVDLSEYDIVIKLHTKNQDGIEVKLNGELMNGTTWCAYLVDALMGSPERFGNLLKLFSDKPELGLAYSQMLNFTSRSRYPEDGAMLADELRRLGIKRHSGRFCAGTMFAARAAALDFLKRKDINKELFEPSGPSHGSSTMAHVYERLIPFGIEDSGYSISLIPVNAASALRFAIKDITSALFSWILSIDYYGMDGHKYLMIFGIKIRL